MFDTLFLSALSLLRAKNKKKKKKKIGFELRVSEPRGASKRASVILPPNTVRSLSFCFFFYTINKTL